MTLANRSTEKSPDDEEQNVERKVNGLLNKLTMEKFDSISDQIIEFANKSEAEKDCRTISKGGIQLIRTYSNLLRLFVLIRCLFFDGQRALNAATLYK